MFHLTVDFFSGFHVMENQKGLCFLHISEPVKWNDFVKRDKFCHHRKKERKKKKKEKPYYQWCVDAVDGCSLVERK